MQPSLLVIENFNGLDLRSSERLLRKKRTTKKLLNVEPTKAGGVMKCNGYARYNTTQIASGANVRGIYRYIKSDGTEKLLAAVGAGLYEIASNGAVTTINAALFSTSTGKVKFVTFNDVCIICTGKEVPLTYDGSSTGSLTGLASLEANIHAGWAAVYRNRLILTDNPNKPSRVYYSEAGKHNDWVSGNGAGSFDVNVNDGQATKAVVPLQESAIIFKERSIHLLTGSSTSDFANQPVSVDVGTKAPHSIVMVGSDLFFWSDGRITSVRTTEAFGSACAEDIGFDVQSLIAGANASKHDEIFAIHHEHKGQVWWFFPDGASSQNNTVLIFDYTLSNLEDGVISWWKRSGFTGACGIFYNKLPYVGGYDGWIYKHDWGGRYLNADGTAKAIEAYYHTWYEHMNRPTHTKRIRSIDLTLDVQSSSVFSMYTRWDYRSTSQSFNVSQSVTDSIYKYGGAGVLWGSAYYNSNQEQKITRQISGVGNGKVLQVQFENNAVDAAWSVLAMDIVYYPRGIRYGSTDSWY